MDVGGSNNVGGGRDSRRCASDPRRERHVSERYFDNVAVPRDHASTDGECSEDDPLQSVGRGLFQTGDVEVLLAESHVVHVPLALDIQGRFRTNASYTGGDRTFL